MIGADLGTALIRAPRSRGEPDTRRDAARGDAGPHGTRSSAGVPELAMVAVGTDFLIGTPTLDDSHESSTIEHDIMRRSACANRWMVDSCCRGNPRSHRLRAYAGAAMRR